MTRRLWIASATGDRRTNAFATPRLAAESFFTHYPTARKCDVREWRDEGGPGLVRRFAIGAADPNSEMRLQDFGDVTRKGVATLPGAEA